MQIARRLKINFSTAKTLVRNYRPSPKLNKCLIDKLCAEFDGRSRPRKRCSYRIVEDMTMGWQEGGSCEWGSEGGVRWGCGKIEIISHSLCGQWRSIWFLNLRFEKDREGGEKGEVRYWTGLFKIDSICFGEEGRKEGVMGWLSKCLSWCKQFAMDWEQLIILKSLYRKADVSTLKWKPPLLPTSNHTSFFLPQSFL